MWIYVYFVTKLASKSQNSENKFIYYTYFCWAWTPSWHSQGQNQAIRATAHELRNCRSPMNHEASQISENCFKTTLSIQELKIFILKNKIININHIFVCMYMYTFCQYSWEQLGHWAMHSTTGWRRVPPVLRFALQHFTSLLQSWVI